MKRMHALCHPGHSKDTKSPEMKRVAPGKKKHWHKNKNNRSTKRESLSSTVYLYTMHSFQSKQSYPIHQNSFQVVEKN